MNKTWQTYLKESVMLMQRDEARINITDWQKFLNDGKLNFNEKMEHGVPRDADVKLSEFKFSRTLGKGAFGRVMLTTHTRTGHQHATKLLSKQQIVQTKQVQAIRNEKKLLESFSFTYTVNMDFFFQDNVYLYFIMPLIEAGDIFNLLQSKGRFDEHLARFYAAQVLLALEYMHYLDLVYRDMKPENILLDRRGFIKVADYGFVKEVKERTYTFCGTPEYIAPEIIQCRGYNRAVDYWAFGVLLYEFNSGTTPFYSKEAHKMYEKIVQGTYNLKDYFSVELRDIIRRLLQKDITRRYGTLRRGIEDIKQHAWFNKIIWLAFVNKSVKPPYVPPQQGFFDTDDNTQLEKKKSDPYHDIFANF